MIDDARDEVLNRLIEALAAQLEIAEDRTLAPGAVAALADLSRAEVRLIFGTAGHRVHYDADTEPIATLIRLISDVQRAAAAADAVIRPGDEVHLRSRRARCRCSSAYARMPFTCWSCWWLLF